MQCGHRLCQACLDKVITVAARPDDKARPEKARCPLCNEHIPARRTTKADELWGQAVEAARPSREGASDDGEDDFMAEYEALAALARQKLEAAKAPPPPAQVRGWCAAAAAAGWFLPRLHRLCACMHAGAAASGTSPRKRPPVPLTHACLHSVRPPACLSTCLQKQRGGGKTAAAGAGSAAVGSAGVGSTGVGSKRPRPDETAPAAPAAHKVPSSKRPTAPSSSSLSGAPQSGLLGDGEASKGGEDGADDSRTPGSGAANRSSGGSAATRTPKLTGAAAASRAAKLAAGAGGVGTSSSGGGPLSAAGGKTIVRVGPAALPAQTGATGASGASSHRASSSSSSSGASASSSSSAALPLAQPLSAGQVSLVLASRDSDDMGAHVSLRPHPLEACGAVNPLFMEVPRSKHATLSDIAQRLVEHLQFEAARAASLDGAAAGAAAGAGAGSAPPAASSADASLPSRQHRPPPAFRRGSGSWSHATCVCS